MEIIESAGESQEGIMRYVVGKETWAIGEQSEYSANFYDEAGSENDLEESGNGSNL